MIKKIVGKIFAILMAIPRKLYYKKIKKRLNNHNFSLIASDCFGSFVYHNMGLRFNSPTINLFFSTDDFIEFATHLEEYLKAELVEIEHPGVSYPVGMLTYNDHSIKVNFMHYHSFEEAKNKWNERKKRVDFSNLYIIQVITKDLTQERLDRFNAIPFKNKLLITHENDFTSDCMITHPIFSKANYKHGEILNYRHILSCKRTMDDIDYISFLNK